MTASIAAEHRAYCMLSQGGDACTCDPPAPIPMPVNVWPRLGYRMVAVPIEHPIFHGIPGERIWKCSHCGRTCHSNPICLQRISDGRILSLPQSHYWKCYYNAAAREGLATAEGFVAADVRELH